MFMPEINTKKKRKKKRFEGFDFKAFLALGGCLELVLV
jgi:hypothetical protein